MVFFLAVFWPRPYAIPAVAVEINRIIYHLQQLLNQLADILVTRPRSKRKLWPDLEEWLVKRAKMPQVTKPKRRHSKKKMARRVSLAERRALRRIRVFSP